MRPSRLPTALLALVALGGAAACDLPRAEDTFTRTVEISGHLALAVANVGGATCVSKGPDGKVTIIARVRARSASAEDATRLVRDVVAHPPVVVEDGRISLGTVDEESDVQIDWRVQVPRDTELAATGVAGHTCATDLAGPVSIETVSGNAEVAGIAAPVTVHSISGDVSVDAASDAEVRTVSGDVSVTEVFGDVRIETISGDVQAGDVGEQLHASTVSGEITVDSKIGAHATWEFETASGDVSLGLAPDAVARLELRTTSGELQIPVDAAFADPHGADAAADVGHGAGGLVSAHTVSGNLHAFRR